MRDFQSSLDMCGIKDLSYTGETFTWVNKQGVGDFIHERLDRFVGSYDWRALFSNSQVSNLSFYHSDHQAIKLSLGSSWVWVKRSASAKKKRRFHFKEIWASGVECREVVALVWATRQTHARTLDVVERLHDCAVETDEWGFKKYGQTKKRISELQRTIECWKSDNSFRQNLDMIRDMEKKLEALYTQDEIYWKQRSRMEWLAHGDRNSKVFHHKAT
ncbi:hypothetical protein UlMin_019542 [Ulmus minor]